LGFGGWLIGVDYKGKVRVLSTGKLYASVGSLILVFDVTVFFLSDPFSITNTSSPAFRVLSPLFFPITYHLKQVRLKTQAKIN